MDTQTAAALELARRRAKQAMGAIRKGTSLLTQVDTGFEALTVMRLEETDDVDRALERIRLALAERGAIDLVLLQSTHTQAPAGAKED